MKSLSHLILPTLALFCNVYGQESDNEYGNCTTFIPDDSPGYLIPYHYTERVSGGVTCPSNTNRTCPLRARGDYQVVWRENASLITVATGPSGAQYDPFVDSIQAALGNRTLPFAPSFNATVIGPIDNIFMLDPGQSAYLNFTALQFCFTGRTDGCNMSLAVADGTPVEVCAPSWSNDGREALLSGHYTVVNVSETEAASLSDPFKGQSRQGAAAQTAKMSFGLMAGVFAVAVYLL